jgi:hypothetical protein
MMTGLWLFSPFSTGFVAAADSDRTSDDIRRIIGSLAAGISEKDKERRPLRLGLQELAQYDVGPASEAERVAANRGDVLLYTNTVERLLRYYPTFELWPSFLRVALIIHEAMHASPLQQARDRDEAVRYYSKYFMLRMLGPVDHGKLMRAVVYKVRNELEAIRARASTTSIRKRSKTWTICRGC